MAPDGRCKSFSDGADGAGWSEGCGVLVLKRRSDAVRDGDEILALIRGSAVNQDGRSQGLTAPNGPSQQRVIRAALSASGLGPDDIDVVEAHGTGTRLGDPIEAGALASVFGPTRGEARPLWLGSSKSNLGHTQAAAGVLGVMKMVLALRHEMLPKTLHAGTPSRHIAWQGSGLSLLQEARPWRREALRVRRAGVSSFGISGTNAHVVLEEASARQDVSTGEEAAAGLPMPMPIPLLVSGRDAAALRAQAVRYGEWLAGHPEADWSGVVGTAALHRTQFGSRASVSARDASEAVDALRALGEGRAHAMVSVGEARDRGRVVFVFPGQGSQWPSMGRTLLAESAVFAEAIAACEAALSRYTDWSLTAVLRGDGSVGGGAGVEASLLERVDVIQPALFAMNVGLAAVWRSFGLEPSAVVGHSQGEIAAAVVAGILTLEEGARVVALRSRLLRGLGGGGGMAVTELAAAVVEERLQAAEWSGLSLAVVNTAGSTVVSGTNEAIERWVSRLGAEGVFCRRIDVDYASHSAGMDPILPELERLLSDIAPQAGRVAMVSTVTGARCEGASLDGGYWCRNLRQPVRLDLALAELMGDGHGVFVEVSSHPVLAMALTAAGGEGDGAGVVVGSLRREAGGLLELLRNLAVLHVHGVAVDWERVLGAGAGQAANRHVVSLPTYAFQRQRYWLEAAELNPTEAKSGKDLFWKAVQSGSMERIEELLQLSESGQREHLSALLPALNNWYARTEARTTVDGWCYEERWQRIAVSASSAVIDGVPPTSAEGLCWLVSGNWLDGALLERLHETLQALGAIVECLTVNEAMARLQQAEGQAFLPRALVYLAGGLPPDSSLVDEKPWLRATSEAVKLAQRISQRKDVSEARLWLCTPHALRIRDDDVPTAPYLQALWGLGRTLRLELPNCFGGLIDLGLTDDLTLRRIAATFLSAASHSADDEFALRGQEVWTRRLHHAPSWTGLERAARSWEPQGAILITGGTGALGSFLSYWLAERGARHLILTSRRGEHAPGAADLVAALAGKGCRAEVRACDVSDGVAVNALVRELTSREEAGLDCVTFFTWLA